MIYVNDERILFKEFPAGEKKIDYSVTCKYHYVKWLYESDDELLTLYFVAEHIKNCGGELNTLHIPYCPNARQDRVKNDYEVFTLKYFCNIINSIGFKKIIVNDAHSDVCVALLNNCVNISSCYIVENLIKNIGLNKEKDIVFYPDNGCAKKYEGKIKFPYLIGHKVRDWKTGNIENLDIVGNHPSKNFNVLIVDDICSRGGTFYHAAKKLKEIGANKIYLFVTHLENSVFDGEMINSGLIEHIYTTKSIYTAEDGRITVI